MRNLVRLGILIPLCCSVCFAQSVDGQGEGRKEPHVHFDMDPTKEGLDYLNVDDDNVLERGSTGLASEAAIGGAQLAPQGARTTPVSFVMKPIFGLVLRPVFFATSATEFPEREKMLTNRPTGRPGTYASGLNKELAVYELERFSEDERINFFIGDETRESRESGAYPTKPRSIRETSGGPLGITPYETDLGDKQNTNRPTGRRGGGRGNSRALYPATPNEP